MPISNVYNQDCMEGMKTFPDKFFELAVVDPPYGIGDFAENKIKWNNKIPSKNYFDELERISKEQIIWGANYYNCLNKKGGAIIWDKAGHHPDFSNCEIASYSAAKRVAYYKYAWGGVSDGIVGRVRKEMTVHPMQKPIALYKWLLTNYAKPGDKILDTHLGSQSSRIAAYKLGFDFWGYEIDSDYYEQGCARFEKAIAMPLFDNIPEAMQTELFN